MLKGSSELMTLSPVATPEPILQGHPKAEAVSQNCSAQGTQVSFSTVTYFLKSLFSLPVQHLSFSHKHY